VDGPPERLLREDSLFRLLADLQGFRAARGAAASTEQGERAAGADPPISHGSFAVPSWNRLGRASG
jgi:hypothetical protein